MDQSLEPPHEIAIVQPVPWPVAALLESTLDSSCPPSVPNLAALFRLHYPLLLHTPQGARTALGHCLVELVRHLLSRPTWETLFRSFAFARFCLRADTRGGHHRGASERAHIALRDLVTDRALHLPTLLVGVIWAELCDSEKTRTDRMSRKWDRSPDSALDQPEPGGCDERLLRSLQSLVAEGAFSKAAKQLLSKGIHDPQSKEVLAALRDLHPSGVGFPWTDADQQMAPTHGNCYANTAVDECLAAIQKIILGFPPGSAPGPSGLRPVQEWDRHFDHCNLVVKLEQGDRH